MRILFALAGLHRFDRGAEVAFMAVADELAKAGEDVTLIGSGEPRPSTAYRFVSAGSVRRERFERLPKVPLLRNETVYEDATFSASLLRLYRPRDYDLTVTCAFPFTNLALRRPALGGARPPHVFVTQNGDWAAYSNNAEYRLFGCDGLVCINPDYFERNSDRWRCALIPNGVDMARFTASREDRSAFGLPADRPVILMVSALIPSKRVEQGVLAASLLPDAHLVVAGDGPLRDDIAQLAQDVLPGRFTRITVPVDRMPSLYRSADVFLHLSKEESFGNVFVEAMACGLPIVGHDSPRLRWIVGENEFLLDTSAPKEIAASIQQALDAAPAGQEERVRRAGGYDWSKIAAQYRSFFEEVVASRQ